MLVLSRSPNQEILFPNTGIRIRLLQLKGNVAKIGIEAPPEVHVLRSELVPEEAKKRLAPLGKTRDHALRNQLNNVSLSLHRFQQQYQAGLIADANETFERVLAILDDLDRHWPGEGRRVARVLEQHNRWRALLVEDDANERELLAGILTMHGCDCETAADGQDALDYLATHELPDLVLLDMGLPRVSGPQTLERIRQEPRCQGLKVFAISGSSAVDLGIAIGNGGVDAWFNKPLNPRRLWDAIRQGQAATYGIN